MLSKKRNYNISYLLQALGFTLLPLFFTSTLKAQARHVSYKATEVKGKPPVIDGHLNDKAWKSVPWGDNFTQYEPYNEVPPTQKTAFKILYDNNNLYVAIRAYDTDPSKIERILSRRDKTDGDWVAIGIDSYNDKLTGFVFSVNAVGVKFDGKFTNDNQMDATWNPVWYVKTSIDSLGWVAEMRIPLSQLRFAKVKNHVWGLQFMRKIYRKQELDLWSPQSKEESGWVSHWGDLTGIDNIHPKKEVALTPYVLGKLKTEEKQPGNPFANGVIPGYSVGLDGKIAVTNDLTLNFTVNPDFGQVEADPSVVNLSAFETYFPERRLFFVEENNIFSFPLTIGGGMFGRENLFYSRRIGRAPHNYPHLSAGEYAKVPEATRILGAFKLSGKTRNGWSIGVLESLTNNTKATIDSAGIRSKQTIEPMTNYFNTRIQKDINKGKTIIGGMVTATNRFIKDSTLMYLPTAAYTGGVDFQNFWKDKAYRLSAKVVGSSIKGSTGAIIREQRSSRRYYQKPDGTRKLDTTLRILQGTGASIEFAKIGGSHWRYGIRSSMLSPGLEINDQGYMRIADIIKQSSWVSYILWNPFSIFRSMNIRLGQWSGFDFKGRNTMAGINLNFNTQFKNYWNLNISIRRRGYGLDRHELRGGPSIKLPGNRGFQIGIGTDSRKKLSAGVNFNSGKGYQHYGKSMSLGLRISYRPLPALNLSLMPNYTKSSKNFIYVTTEKENGKNIYLVSAIQKEMLSASLRVNFSFTPDLSLEYWGQPFLFSGDYSGFKKVINPGQKVFASQFHQYTAGEITYDEKNNQYLIDDNGDGNVNFTLHNPDFSVMEFRSNMVLRWEFVPGSTFFLVWSQGKNGYSDNGTFNFGSNLEQLFKARTTNIFLVKFSYRFSM
ncbi:MAG: hypothetical protein IEMM0006_1622 [bacterium]|nr:MAG: hypothetical protein IEMM0006_1622 [bacterium]